MRTCAHADPRRSLRHSGRPRRPIRQLAGQTHHASKQNVAAVAMANKTARTVWAAAGARARVHRLELRFRRSQPRRHPQQQGSSPADCSGNQQVDGTTGQTVVSTARPDEALRCDVKHDSSADQQNPSGQPNSSHLSPEITGAALFRAAVNWKFGKPGASMYVQQTHLERLAGDRQDEGPPNQLSGRQCQPTVGQIAGVTMQS